MNNQQAACQHCGGDGYVIDQYGKPQICQYCSGIGNYEPFGSRAMFWDKRVGSRQIAGEKFARTFRQIINGVLVAFGVVGFGFGFWNLYQIIIDGGLLLDFWDTKNYGVLIFWISIITDSYIYYRIDRENRPRKTITRQTDQEMITISDKSYEEWTADEGVQENVAQLLSPELEKLLQSAFNIANKLNHREIWPSHLLAAMMSSKTAIIAFARLGLEHQVLKEKILRQFSGLPQDWIEEPRLARNTKELFFTAYREAYQAKQKQVNIPELLIALATTEAKAQELLYDLEVDEKKLRHVVAWIHISQELREQYKRFKGRASWKPKKGMNRAMTAQETRTLNQFGHDLTELARRGVLPITVGREREMNEVYRILERGGSPMIVGSPGVGKTAIIHGLARLMTSEDVPEALQDKRLVSLSVSALVGGAKSTGQLEGRLNTIINEIIKSGNIILFIDNVQNLVGVSSAGGDSFDLSDVLATALRGRAFQTIATTNVIEYRQYIENRSSLSDVFTKVNCEEVDTDGAILILESKVGAIEYKQGVFFTYDALEKTVTMSQRYIHDRYLPEKAITLLEEVAVDTRKRRGKDAFVNGEDVAKVVSEKTNVKVTKVDESESERLLNLESIMHQRMIGQEDAVKAVASALRRARIEMRDTKRPIANFLFLGPTGVGKTELAKTVAEAYFGSEETMIRLDMSEYQDPNSIYRLIGAPPGSGNSQGGYLTEAIRKQPFALVLLDELEKAHPDILNVFLQVMDDGRLTDGTGRTVDFTNSIIIATSNAGTEVIQKRMNEGVKLESIKQELISSVLNQHFKPELINRFDRITVFRPLTMAEIVEIAKLMLGRITHQLKDRGVTFTAEPEAVKELAQLGFDPIYGARPLRRVIQERVDNALANYLLQGKLGRRDVAVLEQGGHIRVEQAERL
ncbi:MAG: ATP-dependent Clp protease ATP-binding subunit [bacterium]